MSVGYNDGPFSLFLPPHFSLSSFTPYLFLSLPSLFLSLSLSLPPTLSLSHSFIPLSLSLLTPLPSSSLPLPLSLPFPSPHSPSLSRSLYLSQGNVILTDHAYTILSLLRVRTDTDTDVRFAIRETFSMDTIKMDQPVLTKEQYVHYFIAYPSPSLSFISSCYIIFVNSICRVATFLVSAKPNEQLKHVLNPHFG